jgi:hypothetical protein
MTSSALLLQVALGPTGGWGVQGRKSVMNFIVKTIYKCVFEIFYFLYDIHFDLLHIQCYSAVQVVLDYNVMSHAQKTTFVYERNG